MNQQAIGILDSGVGGLTVVKELFRQLPRERLVYFGDTARCPYGPRPVDEVQNFTYQIISYLIQYNLKMLVIGCNTATAVVFPAVKSKYHFPVVGVINPGARSAIKVTKNGKVGVIGTVGTIRSEAYEKALKAINPELQVLSHPCPNLVPLVEEGTATYEELQQKVSQELEPVQNKEIDTLILGCTHYPLISDVIQDVMGSDVSLISSAEETAREVSAILGHNGQLSSNAEAPEHMFITSGDPHLFKKIAERFLEREISVKGISWE